MNRAVNGDVVAVEVFPETEWKAPLDEVIDQDGGQSILLCGIALRQLLCSGTQE